MHRTTPRTTVIVLCVIALIGILGFFGYRFYSSRRTARFQAASGASCTGAGYPQHFSFNTLSLYYCRDLDSTLGPPGECDRTGKPLLSVGFPQNGPYHVNTAVPFNVTVEHLGSGDLIVKDPKTGDWAQGGRIDWGDGNGWQNVDLSLTTPLSTAHKYPNAIGSTNIYVMAWAQFKYQAGAESGSYESCVDAVAPLTISP
jgi:hypothetical protein